jgi:hypothetical protein
MSENKDSEFKVTDRRKFNPDGTIRESAEPGAEDSAPVLELGGRAAAAGAPEPSVGAAKPDRADQPLVSEKPGGQSDKSDNVVSFPGHQAAGAQPTGVGPGVAAQTQSSSKQSPQQKAAEQAYSQASRGQKTEMPPATFLAIVNMLGIEAAMHLGMVQVPGHEETQIDLEAARHIIDLLAVLQKKTDGNLTAEEEHLMESLLADLRMQFVSLSGRR